MNATPHPCEVKRSAPPSIRLRTGAEVLFRSADEPDRLRGPNLSGIWLDEASLMPQEAFTVAIGRLREAGEQGWLTATFTAKGRQHWTCEVFATDRPDTAIFHARTAANPFLPEDFHSTVRAQYTSTMAAHIHDVRRLRGTPQQVQALVKATAEQDGRETAILMEQEPGSAGVAVIDYYLRLLGGYNFRGERSTGDKVTRAQPLAAQAEGGKVKIVRGPWNKDFLDEIEVFPFGRHDDQADSASLACSVFALRPHQLSDGRLRAETTVHLRTLRRRRLGCTPKGAVWACRERPYPVVEWRFLPCTPPPCGSRRWSSRCLRRNK